MNEMSSFEKIKIISGKKDLSALGAANIIGSVISALFWFYLAALVGTENYGELSYLLAIVGIAISLVLAETLQAIFYMISNKIFVGKTK